MAAEEFTGLTSMVLARAATLVAMLWMVYRGRRNLSLHELRAHRRPPRISLLRPARFQDSLAAHSARSLHRPRLQQCAAALRHGRAECHAARRIRTHQAVAQLPGGCGGGSL